MAHIACPGCRNRHHSLLVGVLVVTLLESLTLAVQAQQGKAPAISSERIAKPLHRWDFTAEHFDRAKNHFRPLGGKAPARAKLPVQFAARQPQALLLPGDSNSRQQLLISNRLSQANLPKQNLTVEAWVRVERVQDWGGFLCAIQDNGSYEKGWILGLHQSQFLFGVSSEKTHQLTYLKSPQPYQIGTWYHVVGTYDGETQTLYVNGQLAAKAETQAGAIDYPPQGSVAAGAYVDANELYSVRGQLDRVSLWDRCLTAEQVAALFQQRKDRFPPIEQDATPEISADWPTYQHDNARSGLSPSQLKPPLFLQWVHRALHPPRPAWPAPAKRDYWHKSNHNPRVTYDRAYHVIAVEDRVYYASSADDQIRCLDARKGHLLWNSFAEAPIRLAPTIADGKLVYGCDDGRVYCLNAKSGRTIWVIHPENLGNPGSGSTISDRVSSVGEYRIAGNERIIHPQPIRTGVVVEGQTAFFCRGLFPTQGVEQVAVDLQTGKPRARARLAAATQGYLQKRGGRLFVPTGRDPAGTQLGQVLRPTSGPTFQKTPAIDKFPYAQIATKAARFAGGDGQVAAFSLATGKQLWSAQVAGRAYSLAVASDRLLVSTDQGVIYCFSPQRPKETPPTPAIEFSGWKYPDEQTRRRSQQAARHLLSTSAANRGYALVIDSNQGHLAYELAASSQLQIVCLEDDPSNIQQSRQALAEVGLYGRVVVHRWNQLNRLPYTDYLFNLVTNGDLNAFEQVPNRRAQAAPWGTQELGEEVFRVLRPEGGIAIWGRDAQENLRRGRQPGVGQWTHMYADAGNTACSGDTQVTGQLKLQWFGRPGPRSMIDRHHRTVAPLWCAGRLFVPGENVVIAADAYNGTPLWKREISQSARVGALRDCGYLAATADTLYVAAAGECQTLDAETGAAKMTIALPPVPRELPPLPAGQQHQWGYLACVADQIFGSAVKPTAIRRTQSREAINETYYDRIPVVGSDYLFSVERHSGKRLWSYTPGGLIPNPTLCVADQRLFFLESTDPQTLTIPNGRATLEDYFRNGAKLVALDTKTGQVVWRRSVDLRALQHNCYICSAAGKVVLTGSRNGSDGRVHFDLSVFQAETGKPVWSTSQNNKTGIGGSHGEQDHHPLIILSPPQSSRPDLVLQEPYAYQLHTGKPADGWKWNRGHRRGCGTWAASANTLFFRDHTASMFDLAEGRYGKVTSVTRPGCWINMIPAGGLLLVPEASSGCSCHFAVQTSLAFLPVKSPSRSPGDSAQPAP